MLVAVIAAAVTLVVVIVVVAIVFALRSRRAPKASGGKLKVQSISTVGVGSHAAAKGKGEPRSHVQPSQNSVVSLSETLKSRFLAMGVLVAAVFGSLAVKVWSLQILSSEEYSAKAKQNLYTTVSTAAPRGCIYDADGVVLVKNRTSLTVLANAEVASNRDVVQRLSVLLGVPHNVVRQRIQDSSGGAQSQRVVSSDAKLRDIAFISEHIDAFPGIRIQERSIREYPWGALAAHALGYIGTVSEEELKIEKEGTEIKSGDMVGKSGVEAGYNTLLSGDHGQQVVVADADGVVQQIVSETNPKKGNDVYLTIKAKVQYVADKTLAEWVAPNGAIGSGKGTAATIVCMDIRDGGIVAMANYPTYDPETFTGGISQEIWDLFNTEQSHYPLFNRAISGTYPAASCFKAFTGLAGLEYGFADEKKKWNCTGTWTGFGENDPQMCWERGGHGELDFRGGVVNSCDTVFYEIAKDFYDARGSVGETAMQDYVRRFGYATKTGIDIGGEEVGRIPTPEWKAEYFKDVPESAGWVPGDMSNMVIGQGYVLVTPIQVATAYTAIATGQLLKPHLFKEVKNSEGDTVFSAQREVTGTPEVTEAHLQLMRDSLHGVAQDNWEVRRILEPYGIDAAAKTGTAEVAGKEDFSWFACYAPYGDPKFVVACVVEEGGGGSDTAAPICATVLDAALRNEAGTLDVVMTPVAGSTGKYEEKKQEPDDSGDSGYSDEDYGDGSIGRTD